MRAIGAGGTKSLIKISQGFGKCWLGVNKRDAGGSFSCPDRQAVTARVAGESAPTRTA